MPKNTEIKPIKEQIPEELGRKYKLPRSLKRFQLSMYTHLIDWKWKHITTEPGVHNSREYDAMIPASLADEMRPLYRPIVAAIRDNYNFKKHPFFNHMASSQAARISLFAALLLDENVANAVLPLINRSFGRLATTEINQGFQFEYCPESNPLKDHSDAAGTDADLAIAYYDVDGKLTLWLIEHKLTENEFTSCGGYRSRRNNSKHLCRDAEAIVANPSSTCYY